MNYFSKMAFKILVLASTFSPAAAFCADKVAQMKIVSNPQSLAVGKCSTAVVVQAVDVAGNPAAVPRSTTIYFTGSSPSLSFYSDSMCSSAVGTINMNLGSSTKSFYFKGSASGTQSLVVATLKYIDGNQNETILAPIATPTPRPSATPTATPPVTGGISGRQIPSPLYGVT